MDLTRLLRPRSVAVVGASERDDSYAGETLLNLRAAGFAGPVWGVNPNRADCSYTPKLLSGSGVSFKFAWALYLSFEPLFEEEVVVLDFETTGLEPGGGELRGAAGGSR